MEPLSTSLRVGGYDLHQVFRRGNVAVYEQSKGGKVQAYELILIQTAKAESIRGRDYPEREVYPHNELWGTSAWSIVSKDEALQRAERLCAERD